VFYWYEGSTMLFIQLVIHSPCSSSVVEDTDRSHRDTVCTFDLFNLTFFMLHKQKIGILSASSVNDVTVIAVTFAVDGNVFILNFLMPHFVHLLFQCLLCCYSMEIMWGSGFVNLILVTLVHNKIADNLFFYRKFEKTGWVSICYGFD